MYILQKNYNSIRNKSNGAAQKGIYLKQLAAYAILIPPLSLKREYPPLLIGRKNSTTLFSLSSVNTPKRCSEISTTTGQNQILPHKPR